jgi:predicted amidohydrolase YtcJ
LQLRDKLAHTLTPGKLADVAVFDTDLVKVGRTKPADLLQAKVLYTIVDGKVVYEGTGRPAGRQ